MGGGTPPRPDLARGGYPIPGWGVPLRKGHGTSGSIMGWGWGAPHGKDMIPVEVLWDADEVHPPPRV